MQGKTKKILLALLVLAAIGAGIVYYLWNKKPTNVSATPPSYTLTANELYTAFIKDSADAKKYIGDEKNNKVIQINGDVGEVNTTDSTTSVFLKADTTGATIQCSFLTKETNIKTGDNVNIKGMVSGFIGAESLLDELIPGKVVMDRCVFVKQ